MSTTSAINKSGKRSAVVPKNRMRSQRLIGHSSQRSGDTQREVEPRSLVADVSSAQETESQRTYDMISCDVQAHAAPLSASTYPFLKAGRSVRSDASRHIVTNQACIYWARLGMCPNGNGCKGGHDEGALSKILREGGEKVAGNAESRLVPQDAEEAMRRLQQAKQHAHFYALAAEEAGRAREVAQTARKALEAGEQTRSYALTAEEAGRAREVAQAARKVLEAREQARFYALAAEEAGRAREVAQAARQALEAREQTARQAALAAARRMQAIKQEEAQQAEQEARMVKLAKEEAAITMRHIFLDSTVITFSAGLGVQSVLLGFESCPIIIKNLPNDATIKEVCELFTQQGIAPGRFHVLGLDGTPDGKQIASLIGHEDLKMVAMALEEVEFREERLSFEILDHIDEGGMRASAIDANVLTLKWRAPAAVYVVTCSNNVEALAKARELDKKVYRGRRVEAIINRPQNRESEVLIHGLHPDTTDKDVARMVGSTRIKEQKPTTFNVTQAPELIRRHIHSIPGVQLTRFEKVIFNSIDGTYSARVHFGSWTQTRDVYNQCIRRRFAFIGNSSFDPFQLPDPIQYTITISVPQYRAQRNSWNDLLEAVRNKKGLTLSIVPRDGVYIIRVEGEDKRAVGAIKVRVEGIAAGERIEDWHHPSVSQQFLDSVLEETGALLQFDWRLRVLKVYGERGSNDAARTLVDREISRLESLEQTVLLKLQSVRFFVTRGLAMLREELGNDNANLLVSSVPAKIVIRGGEAARRVLDRLIEESFNISNKTRDVGEVTCPICYDAVTSPIKLGCGHAYCGTCIGHFLSSASNFPLSCMGDEDRCHVPIPIPVIQRLLPIQQFTDLMETVFVTHVNHHPQEFRYCKTPDCRQVYRCTTSGTVSVIHCPSCLSSVCPACHEEGHEGMTCADRKLQYDPKEQERLNDQLARQKGFKKCPQCAVWIEKTEGCNHMACKCGAHICWVCLGIFDAKSVYQHMHTAHGGIHDVNGNGAELPFQRVDFAEQQEALRQIAIRRDQAEEQQHQGHQDLGQRPFRQQQLEQQQPRQQQNMQQRRREAEDARRRRPGG
ncbi:hypothetical protein FIBSPDRAFT_819123 [Athelia psychrophila]|uniref:RBR-type E3 ubiquitin transferase n=1 Tax=Athelia psychrophila TaxID=1759441 RepID=A0A166Q752_9AGAM|nr:hypothetical protein FIBSPDRAFT_819123 [Fibularhizoctonia sp. CBS 109695]